MKIITNKDDLNIIIYKSEIDCDLKQKDILEKYIKKIILNIKRKNIININGFYKINVYHNEKFGIILDILKEDELDFFKDFLDFKVLVNYNSDIYFSFDDYFIINNKNIYYNDNKYYINIKNLKQKEILKLSEFSKIVYAEPLEELKPKLKLVIS
jgi:hypothetical protein